jgi:hypothetical protein
MNYLNVVNYASFLDQTQLFSNDSVLVFGLEQLSL